ncbi:unnamed protein product [Durusdinium trenchii]|uniref:ABC transporter domain-containing protein n=2 Tax=Durusdinium trenchii TaxID=1381693 RepID=A0ABP0LQU7_9DINO
MNGYHPEERLIDSASLGEEWVDLSFAIGKTPILKRVTGIASPGRLTGVMGPSGSGKTTLLNVLSGRQRTSGYSRTGSNKQEVNFSGEVFARGRPVKTSFFRGKTAFVFQDNALMDSDTPREALQFSAYLRLSRKVSKSKRDDLVEKLLDDLHLQDSSNVITGGPLRKGLSGGQQKRVAVGVELISNPQMIFLDEPISGLDSYNAFTLMQSLNKLSRTGVPVVLTIHQPSSEIYDLIDDVIFLCKGDVIYQGPRWGLFSHFEQLGFRCPANHNPADFVMFLIHKEDDEVLDQLIGNWRTSTACKQLTTRIMHAGDHFNPEAARAASRILTSDSDSSDDEDSSSGDEEVPKVFGQPRKKRNCCQAQWALIHRDARRIWRDRSQVLAANIQNLLVSLIYGWLFFGAGLQESRDLGFASQSLPEGIKPCDDEVLRNHPAKALARDQCVRMFQVHWGALSIVAINTMMGSITWAITVFQNERSCFLREASSGYYTNFSYFLSKTLFEFPVMAISVVVSILSVYWLMNLNANPLALMAEVLLLSVASSSIVFCLSAQASTPEQAYALAPIAQIPQFAFAGILIPNEMVPLSLRWLKWLCPLYYGMTMMSLSEFGGPIEKFEDCKERLTSSNGTVPSIDVMYEECPGAAIQVLALHSQGVWENFFWWPAFSMCVIFFVGFRLLSVFILWRKSRFVL